MAECLKLRNVGIRISRTIFRISHAHHTRSAESYHITSPVYITFSYNVFFPFDELIHNLMTSVERWDRDVCEFGTFLCTYGYLLVCGSTVL